MATPHINAEMGDFADVVLMPGDPLRAKHIAETFLEDVREVNNVRGMLGFTGTYKGRKISVMGHGMGIPSCSIYTKELITDFGVKKIIRVGSCGAVREDVKLRDVVIGMGACTDSKVNRLRFKDHDFAAIADFGMVRNAVDAAKALVVAAVAERHRLVDIDAHVLGNGADAVRLVGCGRRKVAERRIPACRRCAWHVG